LDLLREKVQTPPCLVDASEEEEEEEEEENTPPPVPLQLPLQAEEEADCADWAREAEWCSSNLTLQRKEHSTLTFFYNHCLDLHRGQVKVSEGCLQNLDRCQAEVSSLRDEAEADLEETASRGDDQDDDEGEPSWWRALADDDHRDNEMRLPVYYLPAAFVFYFISIVVSFAMGSCLRKN
jgi:hypothetical protein